MASYIIRSDEYLAHHGIKGQKWGIRRFENLDGTLTPEGKARYGNNTSIISDYKQTRMDIIKNRPSGFSHKENDIIDKIKKGEIVDRKIVEEIARDHHEKQFNLGKKYQEAKTEFEKNEIRNRNAKRTNPYGLCL